MSDEKPISLEELQRRIENGEPLRLEDGVLIEVPRSVFDTLQRHAASQALISDSEDPNNRD